MRDPILYDPSHLQARFWSFAALFSACAFAGVIVGGLFDSIADGALGDDDGGDDGAAAAAAAADGGDDDDRGEAALRQRARAMQDLASPLCIGRYFFVVKRADPYVAHRFDTGKTSRSRSSETPASC